MWIMHEGENTPINQVPTADLTALVIKLSDDPSKYFDHIERLNDELMFRDRHPEYHK